MSNPDAHTIANELRAKACRLTVAQPLTFPIRYALARTNGNGETVIVGTWEECRARLASLPSAEDVDRAFRRAGR